MTLDVKEITRYNGPFPSFREPVEVGSFSLDEKRYYVSSRNRMKYLCMPRSTSVQFDLNRGYENVIKKHLTKSEKLDNMLKWVLYNKKVFPLVKDGSLQTDFVCYRGLLTTVLCTPYENKDGWIICITKFKGTYYMCQFDTDDKKEREASLTDRDKLMTSWGYKFEQYLSCDEPGGKPDLASPVNENTEFCCVVRSRLSSHSLVYGAEMDCVDPSKRDEKSMNRFVELKTSRHITAARQDRNFKRFKLLKWWAQSFLIGIQEIICGFRDDGGVVHELSTFRVNGIPKFAEGLWQANVCMNFCNAFLNHVKSVVTEDDESVVYKFEFLPADKITCSKFETPSEFHFLPTWYTKEVFLT